MSGRRVRPNKVPPLVPNSRFPLKFGSILAYTAVRERPRRRCWPRLGAHTSGGGTDSVDFRIATPADVPELFRIRTSVRENQQSERELAALGVTRESVLQMLGSGQARAWCAIEGNAMVGFSMARRVQRDVFALFVLPEFEGCGIGSALLDRAVAWLRHENAGPIRLSTARQTRAHALYLSWGWREVGEHDDGDAILEIRSSTT